MEETPTRFADTSTTHNSHSSRVGNDPNNSFNAYLSPQEKHNKQGFLFGCVFTSKNPQPSSKKNPPPKADGFWPTIPESFTETTQKKTRTFFFSQQKRQKTLRIFPRETKKHIESNPNHQSSSLGICESSMRNGKKIKHLLPGFGW